jgi:hypothetical protein
MEAPVLDAAAKRLSVDQFDLSEEAPAARLLYHVAPRFCRASIECHGLDSSLDTMPGLAGTYLWQNVEQARTYAAPLNDEIWIVDCAGCPSRVWRALLT